MSPFEKWSVLTTSLLTAVTGFVYLWMKYFLEPVEVWAVINHPLQPAVLKAHILVAPLMVFAVGMIALRHVWKHFRGRVRMGRRTGLAAAIALAPMIATGYLIQAVTQEGLLLAMAYSHIAFGSVFAVGLAGHALIFTRRSKRPGYVTLDPVHTKRPTPQRAVQTAAGTSQVRSGNDGMAR